MIVVLVLILGIQTGYVIKANQDRKATTSDIYRSAAARDRSPNVMQSSRTASPRTVGAVFGQTNPVFEHEFDSWDPIRELEDMQRLMNRMFQSSYSRGLHSGALTADTFSYNPDMDIKDTGKEYVVRVDLPGIDKDKVNIKVAQNHLRISGERSIEKDRTDDQSGLYRSERSFGSFHRTIPLPPDASSDGIRAESAKGVLAIHIPKMENIKPVERSVDIQ